MISNKQHQQFSRSQTSSLAATSAASIPMRVSFSALATLGLLLALHLLSTDSLLRVSAY